MKTLICDLEIPESDGLIKTLKTLFPHLNIVPFSGSERLVTTEIIGYLTDLVCYKKKLERGYENIATVICYIDPEDTELLSSLILQTDIVGAYSIKTPIEHLFTLVRTLLDLDKYKETGRELTNLGKNINTLVTHSLKELVRVKELHEKLVPLRKESFTGGDLIAKYAAGQSSGGDYFDYLPGEKEALLIFSSTNNYLASSAILSHASLFRNVQKFSDALIQQFISAISVDLKRIDQTKKPMRADLFIARYDFMRAQLQGHLFGSIEYLSTNNVYHAGNHLLIDSAFIEKSIISIKLERGAKLAIYSGGVRLNSGGFLCDRELVSFFKELLMREKQECVNEIFYQLKKKDLDQEFLVHDAGIMILEVDNNAILQM